jgi:hypothetical protein
MITAENWNGLIYPFVDTFGWSSSMYFVSLIIFGNIMLLNLFLAILLNFISENLDEEVKPLETENKQTDDEIIEEELDYI